MTRLPDHMVTGGLQAMDGDVSYKLDDESGRKSPGNIMHFFPNASVLRAKA
jgi:long-chain fatty acid transport protein